MRHLPGKWRVKHIGGADEVTAFYDLDSLALSSDSLRKVQDRGVSADAGPAHLRELHVLDAAGIPRRPLPAPGGGFPPRGRVRPRSDRPRRVDPLHADTDGVMATSWLSHEPDFHDLGTLTPGRHEIDLVADDLLLGDGQYDISVALFEKRSSKAETAFYADPMTIWEKSTALK